MEKEVKAAVITGICAIIAAVIGGAMSGNGLKKSRVSREPERNTAGNVR